MSRRSGQKNHQAKTFSSKKKALLAVEAGRAMKAQEPVVLRVGKLVDYTDYFVIMHGESTRQVQAIFESIWQVISQTGIKPLGIEGEREGRWVVIDWDDVVIHIFYKELRDAGMTDEQAFELTRQYMSTLNIGHMMKGFGRSAHRDTHYEEE